MQANPWRGEVGIRLAEKSYILYPSFEILSRIERELKIGLVALARKLAEGGITIEELAQIVFYSLKASPLSLNDIKQALMNDGLNQALEAVALMFAGVFGGHDAR